MILPSSIHVHVCAELKNHFSFGTHSFLCFPDLFMCDASVADAQEGLNSADCLMTILTLILNPATKSSASELRRNFPSVIVPIKLKV